MPSDGRKPTKVRFSRLLKVCGSNRGIWEGRLIHDQIIRYGFGSDLVVGSTLIDMYAKCGSLKEARRVFDQLLNRDLVLWNTMIAGYSQHGHGLHALQLFQKMHEEGLQPSKVTFSCALKACSNTKDLGQGRQIHVQLASGGLETDVVVASALVDTYTKCGSLREARRVFDKLLYRNTISWNAMIAGYAQQEHGLFAFNIFLEMRESHTQPDRVTFLTILKACSGQLAIELGKLVHDQIICNGLESDVVVGTTLIDMYARCGRLEEAHKVFDTLSNRNVVSWGAMIAGYAQQGHGLPAIELFEKMQHDGIKPDKVMLLCMLKACGNAGAIEQGRLIHDQMTECGLESDVMLATTLIEMYARCGSLEDAHKVFFKLLNRDVVLWGAMIAAYAQHGKSVLAGQLLLDMQRQGLKPDSGIYTSILTACSHACQVQEGVSYFMAMKEKHGITPTLEHFTCMIVLLSRAGCLHEAEGLLQTMHIPSHITGWTSLLAACSRHGNMELGRQCFDQVVQMDPSVAAGYVLMSSIYTGSHLWEAAHELQDLRRCASAWKKPGSSCIEVNKKVHEFIVGDQDQPNSVRVYSKSKRLRSFMKKGGYVPQLDPIVECTSTDVTEVVLHGEQEASCSFWTSAYV